MSDKPPIPCVELVEHYREFKSTRQGGALLPGPYRRQAERLQLADVYLANPGHLTQRFFRSVEAFKPYSNVTEPFVGRTRTEPSPVSVIEGITSGPKAAAYLARNLPDGLLQVRGLGDYVYVDREALPARTTLRSPSMANRFDDGAQSHSRRAMQADLLLRSRDGNRPTIGEVKVSSASGDDADPVYALIQALALASQLVGPSQRERLLTHYEQAGFARQGPVDVLVLLFLIAERKGKRTNRESLIERAVQLCAALDRGALRPYVERVALVCVKPQTGQLAFSVAS